ncbi:tRNA (5-methylaminomethyl-2-thiouridine)(34)-methyltransferase MnmD [Palleronia sp. KMU-117]|uniref:tRNA (5-methylaminomethyl-2-thiouridine)(34)-methyltransferase MnmD n=1 Tax=Palleronia sp. KMU-117 TaxID=3434108 RepID=UPI003D749248
MANGQAEVDWRDGRVPISTRFDDPYFSLEDGLAETRHVFLQGNDLPARFRPGFTIAELGVGTGLNLLAARLLWRESGQTGRLHYVGFEAYPMAEADLRRALSAFPEVSDGADLVARALAQPGTTVEDGDMAATILIGDAARTLPGWSGRADAWFLDGFSPAKNPGLWTPDLLAGVARHTAPGGSAATYSAAGAVRRALAEAGFQVERRPGFGRKRHMTVARMPE